MGLIRPLLQNPLPSPSSSSSPTSIMEVLDEAGRSSSGCMSSCKEEDVADLRRGPWTVDEDLTLINHIAIQGEGRWNSLARNAGLKRTGKSCRLRWLNYLCPDVRRGNITLEEQLLILELHSRWGNQWSKIAQQLPGRTDNEIKNYWRTRVQKHAKQLKCDTGSSQFKEAMKYLWMPRLTERTPTSAGMTFSAEGSTITSATSMSHLAEISVRSYTGTDPENSCTTASSSEHPFYATHEVSAPNNNEYYPVVAIDDSFGDERWNQQGQSGNFHQHGGYYHRQQLESGMEFRAVDDHQRQQNHHNNSNDQIQRCWWSGHGGESSDNIWNNVAEDFDQWYSQNSRFDP